MACDHYYVINNEGPIIEDTLTQPSGTVANLTGYTLTAEGWLSDDPTTTFSTTGTVALPTNGKARFTPSATLFPSPGIWLYQWRARDSSNDDTSFPNDRAWFSILVSDRAQA